MRTRRAKDWALVALATGGAGALVAATVATVYATAGQGYWAEGYYRLLAATFWTRWDEWAAGGVAVTLLVAGALVLLSARTPGRRAVRAALVTVAVVAALRALAAGDAWRASRGPNVLLISIDTLRADGLGAYGQALPTSPAIDRRLAAEGVLFERCYSQAPKTTPSHMTMLTSLYPRVHGIEMWSYGSLSGPVLNPAVHTLAEVLKNAGYATAAFTGGANVNRLHGFAQGFDVYKHGRELERALPWISAHRRRKFFLFFHTYQVHDPYLPPQRLVEQFAPDYDGPLGETVSRLRAGLDGGWTVAHKTFWRAVDARDPVAVAFVARLYQAGIRQMDDTTVNALLDRLDALGLARDTLVVFTSDHGEAFAEHGAFLHDDLYRETLQVPLVLRFPGRLPRGVRVASPARVLDVMPTILALLGVPAPSMVQGRTLIPFTGGVTDAEPDGVVSEYSDRRTNRVFESLRSGPLTYIVDGSAEQLFDTAQDPGETVDLAAERPADLRAMRAELLRWRRECAPLAAHLGPRGPGVAPSAQTIERLRALGYVE